MNPVQIKDGFRLIYTCRLSKDVENGELGEIDDDFEELIEIPTTSRKEEKRICKKELERQKIRDKFPQPDKNGRFHYALAKAQTNHVDIMAYVSLAAKYGESPTLIASAFLENLTESELNSWDNKLILIVEIFLKSLIQYKIMKN